MSDAAETERPAVARRDRTAAARRIARARQAEREARVVNLLNGGACVSEIAVREGVTERHMRRLIETILKKQAHARRPRPVRRDPGLKAARGAARLVQCDVGRANLEAVDRVVKIVRELDRYHGVEPAPAGKPKPRKLVAPPPLALAGPKSGRTQMAPQAIEKSRFADANGNTQPVHVEAPERVPR